MENASKALIIAGAILLSILIIGLGIRVYNNASSSTSNTGLEAQEISAHNSKFLSFKGKQKGNQVITLLNMIQSNNSQYDDRRISVAFSNTTSSISVSNNGNTKNNTKGAIILASNNVAYFGKNEYLSNMNTARNSVNETTTYQVSFEYTNEGMIVFCDIRMAN